ncbi:CMRF35-like molecule 5 isoform 2-T2 [Clarias gariepinus]
MLGMKFYVCSWLFFAVQKEISAILRLNGKENEQLTFTCSHSWAVTNVKYICRLGCSDKDILIRSVGVGIIAKKERYSLYDRGRGLFTITINRLKKSDAGKYWCGIERTGFDTYQEVNIRILDAPQVTETPSTQTTVMTHVKVHGTMLKTTFSSGLKAWSEQLHSCVCIRPADYSHSDVSGTSVQPSKNKPCGDRLSLSVDFSYTR